MLRPKIVTITTYMTENGGFVGQEILTFYPPFWHWPWYWWKFAKEEVALAAQRLGALLGA